MALFIVQNLKKILAADPELWGCTILGQKWSLCPKQIFFGKKLLISFSSYYLTLSLCKILKKFLQRIQSYEDPPQYGPFSQMRIFFRKPVNKPCSFHSCLSTSQKSKSDINLLMKYWQLKNTEIWLAESHFVLTWEPDFSQACSFHRMSMNHKNFRFTQIPDKTNDMIFLKSSKTLFLGHFWPFLVIFAWWRFFPKNPAVTHNYI